MVREAHVTHEHTSAHCTASLLRMSDEFESTGKSLRGNMSSSAKCASERGASVVNVGFSSFASTSASCTFAADVASDSASLPEEALLERGAESAALEYTSPGGLRSGERALLPTSPSRSWRICRKRAGSSSCPLGPFAGPLFSSDKRSDSRVNLQLQLQWAVTSGYSGTLMDWSRDWE